MYAIRGKMRRSGPPGPSASAALPIHPVSGPAAPPEQSQYPKCAADLCTKILRIIKAPKEPGLKTSKASLLADLQTQIDNEIFCLSADQFHLCRLSPLNKLTLYQLLAETFKDKVDDLHRQTFFEVLFLGKEDDPLIHEQRISILFNYASYALQYPLINIFISMSPWLIKKTTPKAFPEKLIALLTEHFIKPESYMRMYEFLYPLNHKCPEFIALFITLAHRSAQFGIPLASVLGLYLSSQHIFILKQFRDDKWMAEEFAKEVFPKCIHYIMTTDIDLEWSHYERGVQIDAVSSLCTGIVCMVTDWSDHVQNIELDFEPIFDTSFEWTASRYDLLIYYARRNEDNFERVKKLIDTIHPPKWVVQEFEKYFTEAPLEEGEID